MTMFKKSLFVFHVAILLALATLSGVLPVAAQSPTSQESKSAQSKDDEQPDLINADRPGIADGSTTIGPKRLQIESGIQEDFRREGDNHQHTLFIPSLLRIGFDSRWEARIEGNTFTRVTTFDPAVVSQHTSGLAPLSLGLKYHFLDSKGIRHPSLGTIIRVFPASGTGDFRSHHVTGDLRLAADWDFWQKPKLSLNPNVGIGRYEDGQGRTFTTGLLAMTLNYLPTNKLNPFIDMGLQAPEESDGKSSVILDTGVAYIVGHNVQLDASIGSGAHGHTPPHPFIGFGISHRSRAFGQKKGH
jgi:hypothetical protein